MAKEKKRGFFSWLGFGQKEQTPEKETEVQNEQPVVEEIVQAQEPAKASEQAVEEQPQAHTEAEAETFAADVVEVTEQVAESEKAQPEAEVVAQPEPVVEETPEPVAIEREELPLPEDVNAEEVSPEEWQAEAETVEIVEAAEEEAAKEEITDEELEDCRRGLLAGMNGLEDTLGGIETWYYIEVLRGGDPAKVQTPTEARAALQAVTKDDVRAILRKLTLSVSYLLTKEVDAHAAE